MKLIFVLLIIISNSLTAQDKPVFKNDTLTTSCGYKIYKGLLLQFGKATRNGEFQYVNIKNNVPHLRLQNRAILIKELKGFGISALGNGYITIKGVLVINNNEREDIIIHLAFDHAIENIAGIPSELVVPKIFIGKRPTNPDTEIDRLTNLYKYGTITLEELQAQKKILLEQTTAQ